MALSSSILASRSCLPNQSSVERLFPDVNQHFNCSLKIITWMSAQHHECGMSKTLYFLVPLHPAPNIPVRVPSSNLLLLMAPFPSLSASTIQSYYPQFSYLTHPSLPSPPSSLPMCILFFISVSDLDFVISCCTHTIPMNSTLAPTFPYFPALSHPHVLPNNSSWTTALTLSHP